MAVDALPSEMPLVLQAITAVLDDVKLHYRLVNCFSCPALEINNVVGYHNLYVCSMPTEIWTVCERGAQYPIKILRMYKHTDFQELIEFLASVEIITDP